MVYLVKSARYVFKIADVVIQRTIPHLKKIPTEFLIQCGENKFSTCSELRYL